MSWQVPAGLLGDFLAHELGKIRMHAHVHVQWQHYTACLIMVTLGAEHILTIKVSLSAAGFNLFEICLYCYSAPTHNPTVGDGDAS
jgi:hypothetical protein